MKTKKILNTIEEGLILLKELGFSINPCMNGAYHYYIENEGKIQVYLESSTHGWDLGYIYEGDWKWTTAYTPDELKKNFDDAIKYIKKQ